MKTFKKEVESNKLVIEYDDNAQSPREWEGNLGYFLTVDSKHNSPDNHPDFEEIIKETADIAKDQESHIKLIKKEIEVRLEINVLAVFPVAKYEHSGISYSLGAKHGFDYSNNGFYIITEKSAKDYCLTDTKEETLKTHAEAEISSYNDYINGNIYKWTLYNDQSEVEDSGSDYYDLESIKCELPKEWKDEDLNKYVK